MKALFVFDSQIDVVLDFWKQFECVFQGHLGHSLHVDIFDVSDEFTGNLDVSRDIPNLEKDVITSDNCVQTSCVLKKALPPPTARKHPYVLQAKDRHATPLNLTARASQVTPLP